MVLRDSIGNATLAEVLLRQQPAWAPIHVYPGVLAGMAISVAGPYGTELGLLVVAALVLASIAWHLLKGWWSRSDPSDAKGQGDPAP
jgi:hypothetical protein